MPDLTPSTRNSMKAGDRGVIFLRKTSQNTVNNDVLCLRALKPRRNVIFEPLSFDNMHPRCNIHPLLWHVVQQCFFISCAFALASLTGKDEFCHKCLWIPGIYDSI